MRNVRISEDVYQAIASQGKFGESVDDVLKRVLGIPEVRRRATSAGRTRQATKRMSTRVNGNQLIVEFADGQTQQWPLPAREETEAIRRVRDDAVRFAEQNGATIGQVNAVKKALTDARYYVSGLRR